MKNLSVYLTIILVFYTQNLFAESLFIECNNCFTDINYQHAASSVVERSSSTVFVGNLTSQTLKKYYVTYERELEQSMLWEVGTSSAERDSFAYLVNAKTELYNYYFGPGADVVPSDIAGSAYDLLGRHYKQTQVIQWIDNNKNYYQEVTWALKHVASMLGKVVNIEWTITVRFVNGDRASFLLTPVKPSIGSVALKLHSVYDKNDNLIPLNSAGFEGQSFKFESDSLALESFLEAASRMGVPTVRIDAFISHSSGSVTITEIVCDMSSGKPKCSPVSTPNNPK